MTALPDWLLEPTVPPVAARPSNQFVASTIRRLLQLRAALAPPERKSQHSDLDPRAKLVALLAGLVAVSLVRHPLSLTGMLLVTLASVLAGGKRIRRGYAVAAVPAALLTVAVLLPGTLSVVRPGPVVVVLWQLKSAEPVGLTASGLANAWLVLARMLTSLGLMAMVTVTTPWLRLMAALRALRVPAAFVAVATLAHRYLLVLADVFADLLFARRARTVIGATGSEDRAFLGATMATLFARSSELADEVHQAMVARGFTGELRDPEPSGPRARDAAFAVIALLVAAGLVVGDGFAL
jgi:cobalt/nickel transport system permease protein